MEEETISMTMEEDNNQYNPIEIKDNRIYNNYRLVEKEEENNEKKKVEELKSGGGYERERRNEKVNTNKK
ncbi:hypothetical protein ENUP19_0064G0008 [Entamoeba nuttalli]|uniref:Uncharacterized protein n=1 Tax=Entamoeba nuttalli TaxID=412467 RepID=A0ABQ0DEG2_9EUKA